jgi:hypothetical protein
MTVVGAGTPHWDIYVRTGRTEGVAFNTDDGAIATQSFKERQRLK